MIHITDAIALSDAEVTQRFVRATGDRGQNVNKDATAVELRFDIRKSSLPREMQERLVALGGKHVTNAGVLMVVSRASGSQGQNRETAQARLLALLKRAAKSPAVRQVTQPPAPAREDRLTAKHRQAALKRLRTPTDL